MNKTLSILTLSFIITFGLFIFMAFLIKSDQISLVNALEPIQINVITLPEDTKITPIVRKIIQPPQPPPMMKMTQELPTSTELSGFDYTPTKLVINNGLDKDFISSGKRDNDARPLIRINPKYPITALRDGIQGWVVLAFDVNEIGEVINVKVVNAEPKRIFDKAAIQALSKWKYNAKSVEGKPVQQHNFTVQLDFTMEQTI